eukprot:4344890-Lingulodinium_polyedra.AAC.1
MAHACRPLEDPPPRGRAGSRRHVGGPLWPPHCGPVAPHGMQAGTRLTRGGRVLERLHQSHAAGTCQEE